MPKAGSFQKLTLPERVLYKLISNRFVSPLQRFDCYSRLALFSEKMALASTYQLLGDEHPHNQGTLSFLRGHTICPAQIVDLGCSTGDKTRLLASLYPNARCFGLDLDCTKIDHARSVNRLSNRVSFLCSDLGAAYQGLAIDKDNSLLFLSHVLEHMEAPGEFLSAFQGRFAFFYIEVPDFENSHLGSLRESLGIEMLLRDQGHFYEWKRDELIAICHESRLRVLAMECKSGVIRLLATSAA